MELLKYLLVVISVSLPITQSCFAQEMGTITLQKAGYLVCNRVSRIAQATMIGGVLGVGRILPDCLSSQDLKDCMVCLGFGFIAGAVPGFYYGLCSTIAEDIGYACGGTAGAAISKNFGIICGYGIRHIVIDKTCDSLAYASLLAWLNYSKNHPTT